MAYQFISLQREDPILFMNILGYQSGQERMIQLSKELFDLCAEVNRNENIHVVVITDGGANSFDMEQDLIEFLSASKDKKRLKFCSISEPIARINHPTIAAITGNATAQGLELAIACDIRIALETSHFGLPHINKGYIPWDGGTQRLSRLVGRGKAIELILTGDIINAQEAYRIGLINKTIPSAEVMKNDIMDLSKKLASKGPMALWFTKEAVYKGLDLTLEQGLRLEADLYFLLHTARDRTEGIKAFREKRNPQFKGE